MRLLEMLEEDLAREPSMFRAQLMREDAARLRRVIELAESAASAEEFGKQAFVVGWTPNDLRTHELKAELDPLLDALYRRLSSGGEDAALDREIEALWRAFDAKRLERLVGCLSRVPPPEDDL